MYCPNCGTQNTSGTTFCGNCGTNFNAAGQRPVAKPIPVAAKVHYADANQMAAAISAEMQRGYYAAQLKAIKSSLMACRITGATLFVLSVLYFMDAASGSQLALGECIALLLPIYFVPYGLAPIVRWIRNHGFILIVSLLFIFVAVTVTLCASLFIAPLYIAWAYYKLWDYKRLSRG